MVEPRLDAILAQCLDDMEHGRATVDDCLRRYPAQAAALSRLLGVQDQLHALDAPVPTLAGIRGEQRLLAALATPATLTGGPHMIPTFLTAVPKLVLALVATVAVTGGAVGVSAAVGGPNLPAEAIHVIRTHTDQAQDRPAVTGTAVVSEFVGLCRAQQSGSTEGQMQKQDATAFTRLQDAAKKANQTVAQFCAPILTSSDKDNQQQSDKDKGRGRDNETATATTSAGIGRAPGAAENGTDHANANASDGRGNATEQGGNRTADTATPTATATESGHAAPNAALGAGNADDHARP